MVVQVRTTVTGIANVAAACGTTALAPAPNGAVGPALHWMFRSGANGTTVLVQAGSRGATGVAAPQGSGRRNERWKPVGALGQRPGIGQATSLRASRHRSIVAAQGPALGAPQLAAGRTTRS
jgi:hypothetical protein